MGLLIAAASVLVAPACSDDASSADSTTTLADGSATTTTLAGAPQPSGEGSLDTVPTSAPSAADVADPVPLDAVAAFGDGVTVRIVSVQSVQAEASLPGERSGPGLAVDLEIANGSDQPADLSTVTVDLTTGGDLSATSITDVDQPGFSGPVAPGGSQTARYTFVVAPALRSDITIKVKYSADAPTVQIAGDAADV